MTAIFLVWNRKGLAVAADSALSLQRAFEDGTIKTISTTETSKIFRVPNKSVLAAYSGESLVNHIPISSIVERWAANLPTFKSLYDYAENFIKWYSEDALLGKEAKDYYLQGSFISQFQLIKKNLDANEYDGRSQSEVVDWYYDYWESCSHPNIYGTAKDKYESRQGLEEDAGFYSDFIARFSNYELDQTSYLEYLKEVEAAFEGAYEFVFKNSPWYQDTEISQLKLRSIRFNMDYIFEDEHTTLMLAGYGEDDWIPRCVVFNIFDSDCLLPRINVSRLSNPNTVWYEDIGQTSTVDKFFAPVDYQVLREIQQRLREKFRGRAYLDKVMLEIDGILEKHSDDVLGPTRERVKNFNTERLAFVASQMVALESLSSLIKKDLPDVGGRIDVVQLTRTGFVESRN